MTRNTIKLQHEQKISNLLSKYWGAPQWEGAGKIQKSRLDPHYDRLTDQTDEMNEMNQINQTSQIDQIDHTSRLTPHTSRFTVHTLRR